MIDLLVKISKEKPTSSTSKDASSPKKTQEIKKQFIQFSRDDIIWLNDDEFIMLATEDKSKAMSL